jgi:hypothetical protein
MTLAGPRTKGAARARPHALAVRTQLTTTGKETRMVVKWR